MFPNTAARQVGRSVVRLQVVIDNALIGQIRARTAMSRRQLRCDRLGEFGSVRWGAGRSTRLRRSATGLSGWAESMTVRPHDWELRRARCDAVSRGLCARYSGKLGGRRNRTRRKG